MTRQYGVYTGLLSVIATLCVSYGNVLTLGCSCGDTLFAVGDPHLRSLAAAAGKSATEAKPAGKSPKPAEEYDKWLRPLLLYLCRCVCVSFLFTFQRIASTFHASLKGSKKLVLGGARMLAALRRRPEDGNGDGDGADGDLPAFAPPLIVLLGCAGFYHQVVGASRLLAWALLPLRVALTPLRLLEWTLLQLVVANANA